MTKSTDKKHRGKAKSEEREEKPLTKEEFLKVLNKATRRVPKASRKPEKQGTSE